MTSTDPIYLRRRECDRNDINSALERLLPPATQPPAQLHAAIRHATLAPGKRVRALLTLSTAAGYGGDRTTALAAGCAIEMLHAASLILDDLPSMDNALTRRGQPVTHVLFGESTAILAAIGLLNRAYEVVACLDGVAPAPRAAMVATLAGAAGLAGLTGGQYDDISESGARTTMADLQSLYARKTGALFAAAVEMGALGAGASLDEAVALREFGLEVGVAFQIYDDLLDVLATSDRTGKDVGQDKSKPTLIRLFGRETAEQIAAAKLAAAIESLGRRPEHRDLLQFTRFLEAMLTKPSTFASPFRAQQRSGPALRGSA